MVPLHGYIAAKDSRNADALMPSARVVDLLREYVESTTVAAEAEAERQQAEQERAAEERRAQIEAARSSGVPAR